MVQVDPGPQDGVHTGGESVVAHDPPGNEHQVLVTQERAVGIEGDGLDAHSTTWSARSRSDGGTVRPSVFALFMLMTRSNFVGRSTGRSAGLAPFRILSTMLAARRPRSGKLAP